MGSGRYRIAFWESLDIMGCLLSLLLIVGYVIGLILMVH